MFISSIFIGNELLNGQTNNKNILHIGTELAQLGYQLNESHLIPDDFNHIVETLKITLEKSSVILISGGLGPTADDITRVAVAKALNLEVGTSPEVEKFLREYMAKKQRTRSDDYFKKQAEVIIGAEIIMNRIGLAPGLHLSHKNCEIFLLPGPPREFNPMFSLDVLPRIQAKYPSQAFSEVFHTYGLIESVVEDKFQKILEKFPFISPAYCANLGYVRLTVTYPIQNLPQQTAIRQEILNEYGNDLTQGANLIDDIAEMLIANKWTLASAESCTGGGVGQAITAYAGASKFFVGSINTYANEWKINHLKVKEKTLATVGAVSEECATEMVEGLCRIYGVDCGIAVTGIAGPDGGTAEKPVGLVYIATKTPKSLQVCKRLFGGNRQEVREQTIRYGLNQLRLQLIDESLSNKIC